MYRTDLMRLILKELSGHHTMRKCLTMSVCWHFYSIVAGDS
jgi:hypothetical protein